MLLREEMLSKLQTITHDVQDVNARIGDLTASLSTMEDSLQKLRKYTEVETKKLAAVVEGAVRNILASDHGREYTLARKVGSLRDALGYVKEMRREDDNWLMRAEGDVIDCLLSEVSYIYASWIVDLFLQANDEH